MPADSLAHALLAAEMISGLATEFRSADGINPTDSIAQDRYAAALGGLDFLLSLKFNRER
jgi:hypothetical protein